MTGVEAVVVSQEFTAPRGGTGSRCMYRAWYSILLPPWRGCQVLGLSELDHCVLSHDPECKEAMMLLTKHMRTLKLGSASCSGSCYIWMIVVLAAENECLDNS